jgi:hypothetical protein
MQRINKKKHQKGVKIKCALETGVTHAAGATLIARSNDNGKEDLGIGNGDHVVDDGPGQIVEGKNGEISKVDPMRVKVAVPAADDAFDHQAGVQRSTEHQKC